MLQAVANGYHANYKGYGGSFNPYSLRIKHFGVLGHFFNPFCLFRYFLIPTRLYPDEIVSLRIRFYKYMGRINKNLNINYDRN